MKKENKLLLIIIVVTLLLSTIYLIFKCINYKEQLSNTESPFTNISILNNNLKLDNKRKYEIKINCSNLTENEQLISYKLKEEYQDSKISIITEVLKDNQVLKDNYYKATNINTEILIKNNNYEQIYIINAICKTE